MSYSKRHPRTLRAAASAPAVLVTCLWLGLCLSLPVLLRVHAVEALHPVIGNCVHSAAGSPGMTDRVTTPARVGKPYSVHAEGEDADSDSDTLAQLSAPVLELITPDGCASWSASDVSSLIHNIQRAVAGGVSLVQLRDYESDAPRKAEMAARLRHATKGRALLVFNGDPEPARASGADGIHLPERMVDEMGGLVGPRDAGEWPRVVGCSVHSAAAAVKAARLGADYVQVGTMFATQSHPGKEPEGVEMLNDVRRRLQAEGLGGVFVIGVGGIDASNCCEVVAAGGDGVAAIRCLCFSSDAEGEARGMVRDMSRSLAASGRNGSLGDRVR